MVIPIHGDDNAPESTDNSRGRRVHAPSIIIDYRSKVKEVTRRRRRRPEQGVMRVQSVGLIGLRSDDLSACFTVSVVTAIRIQAHEH